MAATVAPDVDPVAGRVPDMKIPDRLYCPDCGNTFFGQLPQLGCVECLCCRAQFRMVGAMPEPDLIVEAR